jgi:hypothetical protein
MEDYCGMPQPDWDNAIITSDDEDEIPVKAAEEIDLTTPKNKQRKPLKLRLRHSRQS